MLPNQSHRVFKYLPSPLRNQLNEKEEIMNTAHAVNPEVEVAPSFDEKPVDRLTPVELEMVSGGAGTLNFD
jgi:hypothetical protein